MANNSKKPTSYSSVDSSEPFVQPHAFAEPVAVTATVGGVGHNSRSNGWKDGFLDFCMNGFCHPMLWMACCCTPCALGQIMTRVGLNWHASPSSQEDGPSPFKVLLISFAVYMAVDNALGLVIAPYLHESLDNDDDAVFNDINNEVFNDINNAPGYVQACATLQLILEFCFGLFVLILMIKTRAYIRQKYNIGPVCSTGCDDCFCSFCFPACTVAQMGRHTADYDTVTAECCSETGLAEHTSMIV